MLHFLAGPFIATRIKRVDQIGQLGLHLCISASLLHSVWYTLLRTECNVSRGKRTIMAAFISSYITLLDGPKDLSSKIMFKGVGFIFHWGCDKDQNHELKLSFRLLKGLNENSFCKNHHSLQKLIPLHCKQTLGKSKQNDLHLHFILILPSFRSLFPFFFFF